MDELLEIPVLYDDLEILHSTLTTLHSFCMAQDLSNQYKNLGNRVAPSPITKAAERARDKVFAYMQETVTDDEPESA